MTVQLHPTCLFLGVRICLLCLDIINFMFLGKLKSIFMVFLLNILDNGFDLRKFNFSILKNNCPMLVFTLKEKGGLNNIIFLLLILFSLFLVCSSLSLFLYFNSSSKPLLCSACLYVLFLASKISWIHDPYMHTNKAIFLKIMAIFVYFQKNTGET